MAAPDLDAELPASQETMLPASQCSVATNEEAPAASERTELPDETQDFYKDNRRGKHFKLATRQRLEDAPVPSVILKGQLTEREMRALEKVNRTPNPEDGANPSMPIAYTLDTSRSDRKAAKAKARAKKQTSETAEPKKQPCAKTKAKAQGKQGRGMKRPAAAATDAAKSFKKPAARVEDIGLEPSSCQVFFLTINCLQEPTAGRSVSTDIFQDDTVHDEIAQGDNVQNDTVEDDNVQDDTVKDDMDEAIIDAFDEAEDGNSGLDLQVPGSEIDLSLEAELPTEDDKAEPEDWPKRKTFAGRVCPPDSSPTAQQTWQTRRAAFYMNFEKKWWKDHHERAWFKYCSEFESEKAMLDLANDFLKELEKDG